MDNVEYEKIKNYTYIEYCNYLQKKYGKPKADYFTPNWSKRNLSRTNEGLIIHHIKEDRAIMLSNVEFAKKQPYEYQSVDNLTYCDYLEHLFLHILIVEEHMRDILEQEDNSFSVLVGIRGIVKCIVPEINDWFSGFLEVFPNNNWQRNCFNVIKDKEELYFVLLERYLDYNKDLYDILPLEAKQYYNPSRLLSSYNKDWDKSNNFKIYNKIEKLINNVYRR